MRPTTVARRILSLGLFLLPVFITACGGRLSQAVAPRMPSEAAAAPKIPKLDPAAIVIKRSGKRAVAPLALVSRGGRLHSFADAISANLKTDADFDRFVDPQVTGPDRTLAIKLLRQMPPNMRGDFIYYDGKRVLSNRIELTTKAHLSNATPIAGANNERSAMSARKTMAYPPTGGSGGPYLRHYSAQGVTAAMAYATVPCDINLTSGDSGYMYFNAYSAGSAGSVEDAGLWVHQNGGPAYSTPFVNLGSNGGYWYHNWTDEQYQYSCGSPVGIFYGTQMNGLSHLLVGIPDYDPTTYSLPPESSTWHHGAWTFWTPNTQLTSPTGTWEGMTTPCTTCSVARMTTISPGNTSGDSSCFGLCNGISSTPDARWDQIVMGEIVDPCNGSSVSYECTIEYPTDNSWYGGVNYGSGGGQPGIVRYSNPPPVNTAIEGLALGSSASAQEFDASFPALQPVPAATCSDIRTWMMNNTSGGSIGDEPMVGDVVSFSPDGVTYDGVATYNGSWTQMLPDGQGGYNSTVYTYWTLGSTTTQVTGSDYWDDVEMSDRYGCS